MTPPALDWRRRPAEWADIDLRGDGINDRMRLFALLVFVVGCSKSSQQPLAPSAGGAAAGRTLSGGVAATGSGAAVGNGAAVGGGASAQVHLAELISTDAIGVHGAPRELAFIVGFAGELGKSSDCVPKIVQRIATAYLVSLRQDGYSILEGDLPRPMLESCVSKVFGGSTFENDGEMVAFKTPMGTGHVAWRGGFVIVGTRDQVQSALRTPTNETAARWRELLDPLARVPMWMVRIDRLMDDLFGGVPTSYEVVFDKLEKTPKPFFAGVARIRYASPTEAERGARFIKGWIQRGRFPRRIQASPEVVAGFDEMVRAMQKLKIAQTGATLEMRFDTDMFGGLEKMMESMSRMAAQVEPGMRPAP